MNISAKQERKPKSSITNASTVLQKENF